MHVSRYQVSPRLTRWRPFCNLTRVMAPEFFRVSSLSEGRDLPKLGQIRTEISKPA